MCAVTPGGGGGSSEGLCCGCVSSPPPSLQNAGSSGVIALPCACPALPSLPSMARLGQEPGCAEHAAWSLEANDDQI